MAIIRSTFVNWHPS